MPRVTLTLGAVLGGLVVCGVLLAGGAAGLAWTNSEQFCSNMCHEMGNTVAVEFKDTIHDKNRSGVRAVCSDCHVPREPGPMLMRKAAATFEIWGKITGIIDTKEKFEKHRHELAMRVWTRMKQTDSLECRNCHKDASMDPDKQSENARARHKQAKAEGKTCIDCHFGIAHNEPEGPGPQEIKIAK